MIYNYNKLNKDTKQRVDKITKDFTSFDKFNNIYIELSKQNAKNLDDAIDSGFYFVGLNYNKNKKYIKTNKNTAHFIIFV